MNLHDVPPQHAKPLEIIHETRWMTALMSKQPSPIRGGKATDRTLDRKARLSVAKELGHSRDNITTAYCGKKNVM